MLFGVAQEHQEQFVDAQTGSANGGDHEATAAGLPLGDDAGVLDPAGLRAVLAEQHVTASAEAIGQGDDGLAGLLVEAVGRDAEGVEAGHAVLPLLRKTSAVLRVLYRTP